MKITFGWRYRLAACIMTVAGSLASPATQAQAEVLSHTVGIDSTCPYGLAG